MPEPHHLNPGRKGNHRKPQPKEYEPSVHTSQVWFLKGVAALCPGSCTRSCCNSTALISSRRVPPLGTPQNSPRQVPLFLDPVCWKCNDCYWRPEPLLQSGCLGQRATLVPRCGRLAGGTVFQSLRFLTSQRTSSCRMSRGRSFCGRCMALGFWIIAVAETFENSERLLAHGPDLFSKYLRAQRDSEDFGSRYITLYYKYVA